MSSFGVNKFEEVEQRHSEDPIIEETQLLTPVLL